MKGTETQQATAPEVTRAEKEKTMTVYTFLSSFLYASSTIKDVVIYDKFGYKVILHTSTLDDDIYHEELNNALDQFSINGDRIVIYCK